MSQNGGVSMTANTMAAWIVQDVPSVTLTELAERTGREVATLSAAALRLQKRSSAEPELSRENGYATAC